MFRSLRKKQVKVATGRITLESCSGKVGVEIVSPIMVDMESQTKPVHHVNCTHRHRAESPAVCRCKY